MLAAIACQRYEMAIVLLKKDADAAQLFALCYIILLTFIIEIISLNRIGCLPGGSV
jgi:hypothetical protein